MFKDRLYDFDYEAAEHALELPPSLQLVCTHHLPGTVGSYTNAIYFHQRPVQRDNDNDNDVMAFTLDGGASKAVQEKKGGEVMVAEGEQALSGDQAKSPAVTRPSARLTLVSRLTHDSYLLLHRAQLYTVFLVIHYVRDRLTKFRANGLKEVLRK